MASCILPDERTAGIVKIKGKVSIDKDGEKYNRVDIFDIKANDVKTMITDFSSEELLSSGKIGDKKVAPKLASLLERAKDHASFVTPIMEKMFSSANANTGRFQAMALKQVLDTIEGEMNKAVNYSVALGKIQNSQGIPHIPTHRLAASLGRQILYTQGMRVHKANLKGEDKSKDVEHKYYMVGMTALENLAANGFIDLFEKNTGHSSIQDYAANGKTGIQYADPITEGVPVVSLKAESLGAKDLGANSADPVLVQIRGEAGSTRPVVKTSSDLFGLKQAINAITLISVPLTLTFPFQNPDLVATYHGDDYEGLGTVAKVRDELQSQPVTFNSSLNSFFKSLNEVVVNSGQTASQFITKTLFDKSKTDKMFGISQNEFVESDKASNQGRNLASTTPIDDVAEYFDALGTDMYMAMFLGRNSRLYYDNSVVNAHSSKLMRHALETQPYEIGIETTAYTLFVDKVALTLEHPTASKAEIKAALLDNDPNSTSKLKKQLDHSLKVLKDFDTANTAAGKLKTAQMFYKTFSATNIAEMITTVKAVQDIRESVGKSKLKSSYMIGSDATASGGQLSLMQALGSSPLEIRELLSRLGIFKGKSPDVKELSDVYAILQEEIQNFIGGSEEDSELFGSPFTDGSAEANGFNSNIREILSSISTVLFDGKLRDLSKPSTMTFIYDQKEVGANIELSKTLTERFLKRYKSGKNKPELDKLLVSLGVDPKNKNDLEFKNAVKQGFQDSTVPKFMFKALTHAITQPYLEKHKAQAEQIFEFAKGIGKNNLKVFPASVVVDIANKKLTAKDFKHSDGNNIYTQKNLEKYGVPISKVTEFAKEVEGGDTVLTRLEQLKETVMNVSLIHSADTANLVLSLDGLIDKYKSGVIVVHDEVRGRPDLIEEMQEMYIEANRLVGLHYSTHLEVMKALVAYDPSLTSKANYTKLNKELETQQSEKQRLIKDPENGYNSKTTSVIGDKPITADVDKTTEQSAVQQTVGTTEQTENAAQPAANENASNLKTAKSLLTSASEISDIVKGFLSLDNKSRIVSGNESSFDSLSDIIKINPSKNLKDAVMELEHEITHSYTAALVQDYFANGRKNQDLAYIEKTIDRLSQSYLDLSDLGDNSKARMSYILNQSSPELRMSEFLAVMNTEPKVASEIYAELDTSNGLKKVITKVLNRVIEVIKKASGQDNLHDKIDVEQLYSSINSVFIDGKNMRENNFEVFSKLQAEFNQELFFGPDGNSSSEGRNPKNILDVASYKVDQLNDAVSKHVVKTAERMSMSLVGKIDKLLTNSRFTAYKRVKERANGIYKDVYNGSETLQQLMHKITNGNIDKLSKNEILSLFQKISADVDVITSKELERFRIAAKNVSESDKKSFQEFSTKASMTDFFVLYPNGINDIDAEISRLSSDSLLTKNERIQIESLMKFNVNDEFKHGTPYNLYEAKLRGGGSDVAARQFLLVKSIKEIGVDKFNALLKNQELMDVTRDNLMADANQQENNALLRPKKLRDNGLSDEYNEPVVFRAISLEQLKSYDSNKDWKIIREPTKNKPGVVFQKVIDSTFQASVFTTIQTHADGLETHGRFKGQETVFNVDGEDKVILTQNEKILAGLNMNPAQSIVRTMTHNMAIQESNVIREKLMQKETYYDISKDGEERLVKQIKSNPDNGTAWFLNDVDDKNFQKLDPVIKSKYIRIDPSKVTLSNVDKFDTKIKYVRKDIAYWLVGNAEKSIASNRNLQKGIRIVKDLITGTKIGMVILNPLKIAKDNLFNVVYLSTLGVDMLEVGKSYNSISKDFHDYQKLKDRIQSLKVMAYAEKEGKYKNELAGLLDRLEKHPANGLIKRGFVNTLGSEVIMQQDGPGSGFKSDIDKVLKIVLQDNKGQNNAVGRLIMKVSKTSGLNTEGMLVAFSKFFNKTASTKNVESELVKMGERIAHIKSDDDVIAYMHQYLNSPDSEFVKFGTYMTDLTDVLAKETYYRHLVNTKNVSPANAEIEILNSFPDYKEGLPTAVQKLDSVGIVMYPQYWLQMIRAMYRLTEKRPASFSAEVLISQMMGTQSQLWSQVIFEKASSNYGLLHNPVNTVGMGSIVPTNIF